MSANTDKLDGDVLTDAQIRKITAQVYGTLATEQEIRFARALLSASKSAVPLTPNQFAAIRAGCASLQKNGGYAPFGIVLQGMLDNAQSAKQRSPAAQEQTESIYQVQDAPGKWCDIREQDWPLFGLHTRRIVYTVPQATATQPAQMDDARDAARYRFARDNIMEGYELPGGCCLSDHPGADWDRTIDAALTAAQPATGDEA